MASAIVMFPHYRELGVNMDTEADYIAAWRNGGEIRRVLQMNAVDGLDHLRVEYPHDETFIADDVVTQFHKTALSRNVGGVREQHRPARRHDAAPRGGVDR